MPLALNQHYVMPMASSLLLLHFLDHNEVQQDNFWSCDTSGTSVGIHEYDMIPLHSLTQTNEMSATEPFWSCDTFGTNIINA